MIDEHILMTRMLFVDAIVGVGFPAEQVGADAERGGLATSYQTHQNPPTYVWNRRILETLETDTLQELYLSLKTYEVEHGA